jgi:hypothetical protein
MESQYLMLKHFKHKTESRKTKQEEAIMKIKLQKIKSHVKHKQKKDPITFYVEQFSCLEKDWCQRLSPKYIQSLCNVNRIKEASIPAFHY